MTGMSDEKFEARWDELAARMRAGHKLRDGGKPFVLVDGEWQRNNPKRTGYGLCECGAKSNSLGGDVTRRRWHSEHLNKLGVGSSDVTRALLGEDGTQ